MLEQQQMLEEARRPAAQRVAALGTQISDLLGDMLDVEKSVRPGARVTPQLARCNWVQAKKSSS